MSPQRCRADPFRPGQRAALEGESVDEPRRRYLDLGRDGGPLFSSQSALSMIGSSWMRTCGLPSSATAMPSRCRIPRENVPARSVATSCRPTRSRASLTGCAAGPETARKQQVVVGRAPRVNGLGVQQGADDPQRPGQLVITFAADGGAPARGVVQADDQPHCRGFPGTVGPEKAGHAPRLDRERQPVDDELAAVALAQVAQFDHGFPKVAHALAD